MVKKIKLTSQKKIHVKNISIEIKILSKIIFIQKRFIDKILRHKKISPVCALWIVHPITPGLMSKIVDFYKNVDKDF